MANCLVEINIFNCNRCEQLLTLGHLPYLKVVRKNVMNNVERVGAEFYGDTSHNGAVFPSMKEIILRNMPKLVEWQEAEKRVQSNATIFPCLEELEISRCEILVAVPSHFPSVKKLRINGLNNSFALDKISSTLTTVEDLDFHSISESEVNLIIERMLANDIFLADLSIRWCECLFYLPKGPQNSSSLKAISLMWCDNLSGLEIPQSLESLDIWDCPKLVEAKLDLHEPIPLKDLSMIGLKILKNDWVMRLLPSLTGLTKL